jgi:putative redox protein
MPTQKQAQLRLETVEGTSLRLQATTGSGFTLALDNAVGATAPTPVELLLVALGGCTGMDVASILRKKRQDVRHYEVRVTGEQRDEHPKRYARIEVVHVVTGHDISPAAVQEAITLSDTKYCSVHASLDHGIEITSRYEIVPV